MATTYIEILIHYSCTNGDCKKWWTIGDGPLEGEVTCPHCGTKQSITSITNGNSERVKGVEWIK